MKKIIVAKLNVRRALLMATLNFGITGAALLLPLYRSGGYESFFGSEPWGLIWPAIMALSAVPAAWGFILVTRSFSKDRAALILKDGQLMLFYPMIISGEIANFSTVTVFRRNYSLFPPSDLIVAVSHEGKRWAFPTELLEGRSEDIADRIRALMTCAPPVPRSL